jgi:hypothetical protein
MAKVYTTVFFLLFLIRPATAQIQPEQFGKNRVQYRNFDWKFYSTDNFDIYFYEGGQNNALVAAKFLEKEFERITDVIGYAPYTKTKIFLYNSPKELQQSNVGVKGKSFTVGGQTNFVKSQVEIAYPGTMIDFKDELVLQIAEMLINDMMFGGSLTDMFQSAYLLSLPEWFIEGAARYIAEGWSIEMDDFARELFHEQKRVKLSRLSGEEAALAGQSVWNFVAVRYGRSSISNILNLTRIIRNEESSIVNTLGIPFKLFTRQWQSFYTEMDAQMMDRYAFPETNDRLRRRNRRGYTYNQVAYSPDGRYLAYSENRNGRYKVKVLDTKRNKTRTVHTSGYPSLDQELDNSVPLLNWGNNQTLGIIGYEKGKNYLWLSDQATKKKRAVALRRFNQVKYFDLSSNNRLAVMSADLNGQNDLFMYNPNRNTFKRLTTDIYDDLHPHFMPDNEQVVFSSNRPNDSLYFAPTKPRDIDLNTSVDDNFNIYLLHPSDDAADSLLRQVTKTVSRDVLPLPQDDNTIFYLSDQQGVYNLYRYQLRDSLFSQVTNYAVSVQDFDIDFANQRLAAIMLSNERDYVFVKDNFDPAQSMFTPKTQRQQAIQAQLVSQRLLERRRTDTQADSLPAATTNRPPVSTAGVAQSPVDSTRQISGPGVVDTNDYSFGTVDSAGVDDEDYIDTENYAFDTPPTTDEQRVSTDDYAFEQREDSRPEAGNSFLSRYRKLQRESRITGPLPYETRFSADNIITSLTFDPLRKLGFHVEVQMNDMLENHRFFGGLVQFTDLRSASLFAEYQYLKNRLDLKVRYEREGIERKANDRNIQKYTSNHFYVGASLPLSVATRLEFNPFVANTHYVDLSPSPSQVPIPGTQNTNYFGGFEAGVVFDNTHTSGLNKRLGTRGRAMLTHYQGVINAQKSFSNLEVDLRHYQKVHRSLTLATRLFYGNFFGPNQQNYLLGGLQTWVTTRGPENQEEDDPLAIESGVDNSNVLFVDFVNLRGFDFNKFNGTDVLTFSAELRLPVVRYFYQGPIASNFFRNLEFVGFYDIGSAWTGVSPFNEKNSINTEVVQDGPLFRAEIQNFKNPWLQSYGAGIRTVLLGFYVKLDAAYPIEDNVVGKPRFYLSLGYDF